MIPLVKTNLPTKDLLMPRLEEVLYSGYIAQGDFGFRWFNTRFTTNIIRKNQWLKF